MNCFSGYVREVPRGYWAMLRFARDGKPKPVMGEGDKPIVYLNRLEATEAVLKHLLAYMNADYLRVGETAQSKRSEAEKAFGTIFRKGKAIQVERRKVA